MVGTSPRAVGQAMARNPTPLVVPCHRIVAAHGIGGFSPALEIKELLLGMEKKGIEQGKEGPAAAGAGITRHAGRKYRYI